MHAGGDILVTQKEGGQSPFFADALVNGDATVHHLMAARTNFQVYVQKITVFYVTHANAKTISFQDTTGTPIVLGTLNDLTAAAGVPDAVELSFGPHGIALAIDKGFDVVGSVSGPVANVHVEGYYRLGRTINENLTASSAA